MAGRKRTERDATLATAERFSSDSPSVVITTGDNETKGWRAEGGTALSRTLKNNMNSGI